MGMINPRAWLQAHEKPIAGAGAAVVVALGLVAARRRKASTKAVGAGQDGSTPPAGATISGYAPGVADTTGTDVYNALQPQIAQTQSLMGQILDKLNSGSGATPPPTTSGSTTGGTTTVKVPPGQIAIGKPVTPIHTLPVPSPTKKPGTSARKYVVQKGDNLTKIGQKFGVDWHRIYAANTKVIGRNPNLIKPGQVLVIP